MFLLWPIYHTDNNQIKRLKGLKLLRPETKHLTFLSMRCSDRSKWVGRTQVLLVLPYFMEMALSPYDDVTMGIRAKGPVALPFTAFPKAHPGYLRPQ
jgi:hypothetical protein